MTSENTKNLDFIFGEDSDENSREIERKLQDKKRLLTSQKNKLEK